MLRDRKQGISAISGVAPKGARSEQPIPPIFVLRELPGIADIEAMTSIRGIEWQDTFITRCDRVSRTYFGITEDQTRLPRPDRHTFDAHGEWHTRLYDPAALQSYDAALEFWNEWCDEVEDGAHAIATASNVILFDDQIIDGLDARGRPLKCLPRFARQLVVAILRMHPDAELTPEGTSDRLGQEAWSAALEADAAKFRARR